MSNPGVVSHNGGYEIPTGWGVDPNFELELPGGGKILAKKLSVEDVLELGLMDRLDMFAGIAGKGNAKQPQDHKKKKVDQEKELLKALKKDGSLSSMVDIISGVCVAAVVKPKLWPAPAKDEEGNDTEPRVNGRVYVDRVPFADRSFIFERCFVDEMGGEAFERFREGPESLVGTVEEKQNVSNDAEPVAAAEAGS